jgi:ATP-dependent protease ClpP protease subunit
MHTDAILLPDQAILTLDEPITRQSCTRLGRNLEMVVEYYQYREVEIRIASPGGEWADLIGLLYEMGLHRRRRSVRFATRAIGDCAGSAAVLLALGDLGHRSADPHARVLLHEPRISYGARRTSELTHEQIEWFLLNMHVARDLMTNRITDHVWWGVLKATCEHSDPPSWDAVHETYVSLLHEERWLSAGEALDLNLVDSIGREPLEEQNAPVHGVRSHT